MSTSLMTRRQLALGAAGAAALTGIAPMFAKAAENDAPETWDYEYDIVVCGAGGAGVIAALKACEAGKNVLCIDANYDLGGHAIVSGGSVRCGGGTQTQKDQGVEDSPEQYYLDHTNWIPLDSRFNDRSIVREVADNLVEAWDWMLEQGMKVSVDFPDLSLDKNYLEGGVDCETVPREIHTDASGLVNIATGKLCAGEINGAGVIRPFELKAREMGVGFMMNRHMDSLVTDDSGAVIGIRASYTPRILPDGTQLIGEYPDGNIEETRETITVKASQVILATGGSMGNVEFRTMYDPRWTQEYDGVGGEPYSFQDASGEIAGLAIGAGMGSTANITVQQRSPITANKNLGCRYGYGALRWMPDAKVFPFAGATGLFCRDYDGAIHVNLQGKRFANENASVASIDEDQYAYFAAAMGSVVLDEGTDACRRVGGPIWAIFDSAFAKDHEFNCAYPDVDTENGYFFSGDTLEELAQNIVNKYYEDYPMDPATLVATVERYNELVDKGVDEDFGKPDDLMTKKIETGPFYAAWCTPILHDCLSGLRTNAHRQVLNVYGQPIAGLWACGEVAGGHHTHGLGKVQLSAYIAAKYAAQA